MGYTIEEHRQHWIDANIEYGYCLCGCGELTNLGVFTVSKEKVIKGEPRRYVNKHGGRIQSSKRVLGVTELDCKACHKTLSSSHFRVLNRYNRATYAAKCLGCESKRRRETNLRNLYGLDIDSYDRMVREQNGLCAICHRSLSNFPQRQIHVDHCHETNEVRGILCKDCNLGIGMFGDDSTRLMKAASYLAVSRIRSLVGTVIEIP